MIENLKMKNKYILMLFLLGSLLLIIGAYSKISGYEYSKGILIIGLAIKFQAVMIFIKKNMNRIKTFLKS